METPNLTYPRGYKVVKTPRHGNRYYSMVHDCWVRYYGPGGGSFHVVMDDYYKKYPDEVHPAMLITPEYNRD